MPGIGGEREKETSAFEMVPSLLLCVGSLESLRAAAFGKARQILAARKDHKPKRTVEDARFYKME